MPSGDKFCTNSYHLEGVKIFGLQKRKPDTPIEDDDETHCPNTINFSRPRVAQRTTSSHASPLPTIVEESSPSMLDVPPPRPTGFDFCRVIVVQESKVDEKLWHIARVPYNSSKAYWAMHGVTKKNAQPKWTPTPRAPLPRHTLEFGIITNLQHLKSRNFFFPGRHSALCQMFALQMYRQILY